MPAPRPLTALSLVMLVMTMSMPAATENDDDDAPPAPASHANRDEAKDKPASAPKDAGGKDTKEKPTAPKPELRSTTTGKIQLDGKDITYSAETNTIELFNDKDEATASVFYVYYRRTGVANPESRPLVFCFNGGPGSSAVWLHIGGLGPRRVVLPGDGTTPPAPPYAMEDNPDSILDAADLVFVDPVNTGFSRPGKDKDPRQFFGYNEDVGYLGDFIRRFVSEHDRWASPKHLLGESYGALRVSALADQVQDSYGMYLNGVVLLSGLLDFQTLSATGGNDLPYLCYLPTMAACAHYHGCLQNPPPVAQWMEETRAFAFGPYASALLAGNALADADRRAIAAKLEHFTSIPATTWLKANLRLDASVFRKQLLAPGEMEIGRFDARVKAPAVDPLSPAAAGDSSFAAAIGVFSTSINDYLSRGLHARAPQGYEVLSDKVGPWNYGAQNSFMRTDNRLVSALRANQHLHVLVLCGHYDLATPPDGIRHTLAQMDLPAPLRANIAIESYEGGHMFYTNRAASAKMRRDLVGFFTR